MTFAREALIISPFSELTRGGGAFTLERMFVQLEDALRMLRGAIEALDAAPIRGEEAARLIDAFTEIERIGAAGRTLLARRVESSKVWQREGHRTPAQWIAAKTGEPLGRAIGLLETARQLEDLPATREAFRAGRLSETQTREIAAAAAADPRSETSLLETARTETFGALREECRRVRAAALSDESAAHDAIHRRRFFRHWCEQDGAVRLDARLSPDAGAVVIAAIEQRTAWIFTDARRAGRRESPQACAADALVELARERGHRSASGPRAVVHVLVDHSALVRGRAVSGERCEIPGIGPIPAVTARALASDSILKLVAADGADITSVVHLGRTIPSRLRTALEARDRTCVVPGCDVRRNLQIDHWRIPFALGGPATLDNLARLCPWHHHLKTHCGHRLDGGPGAWAWHTPDELEGVPVGEARPPPG